MTTSRTLASAVALVLSGTLLAGQTRVTPPENKYSVDDDVKLGREAAQEARQQLPIMRDERVTSYLEDLGRRLTRAIPSELREDKFRYTFEAVNVREINAFALPGGPMFVNRGTIQAAKNEGELAGVMAHEIAHVALRHGTAQASKATPYQLGSIAGAIAGAIIGGNWGRVVGEGSQFALGTAFLKYGREFERQSDTLGAQILARAGYDPRDMANMFRTIEKQGGSGGPEWLSSHPNPGNRYEAITREAQSLEISNPVRDTRSFDRTKSYLGTLPRAPTTKEATRSTGRSTDSGSREDNIPTGRVERPSPQYTDYRGGRVFTARVPSNWRDVSTARSVTFAPDGAYGRYNGQTIFTHGIEIGIGPSRQGDLEAATDELIESLRQGNPRLSAASAYRHGSIDGRPALQTMLENRSDATGGRESIQITTTETRSGELMYVIGVAPRNEFNAYRPVFQQIVASIRLN